MHSLCEVSVPNSTTLVIPIFSSRPILEKLRNIYIGSAHSQAETTETILSHTYSIPVHVPEAGCTISLDVTSESMRSEFMELMHEDRDLKRKYAITMKLHNFDSKINRAVSWGNFKVNDIEDNIHNILMANLMNELMYQPSFMIGNSIYSPLRWLMLESCGAHRYSGIYSYNVFMVYLDSESIECCKKITIWLGVPVDLYVIRGYFVKFAYTGKVDIKPIYLYFNNIKEMFPDREVKRGYYICCTESFNDYKTSYKEFPRSISDVNIVDTLLPVVYSPYDIIPFISPYLNTAPPDDAVIKFMIPKASVSKILSRFQKFGGIQNRDMVEEYNSFIEKYNGLFKIADRGEDLEIFLANPSVISYLIRMWLSSDNRLSKKYAGNILSCGGPALLESLLRYGNDGFDINGSMDQERFCLNMALMGSKSVLNFRRSNIDCYLKIIGDVQKQYQKQQDPPEVSKPSLQIRPQ